MSLLRSGFVLALVAGAAVATGPGAIPGFILEDGAFIPDEPFREGQPRVTGLQYVWPAMPSLDTNPMSPEKVALGKLLYFDPILSGDNTMSCATCHHPDLGFSDGRGLSMGVNGKGIGPDRVGGQVLARGAPTIWNSAYNHLQFWDGRAKDLEEQAISPITSEIEMNQDPGELVEELRAIPAYVTHFQDVFGGSEAEAVTFENTARAIAAFERTLLSFSSRYDRYTQGDANALTEQEKRGLNQFRSVKTRCFECHRFPHFADDTFRVLGVPRSGHDPGRAGVPGQGPDGAFKVPTLRNIALTAPYMHNGAFETLEEVIDFYAEGGGRFLPNPPDGIDDKIGTFPISEQEKADLVAFLHALTDTSLQPDPPKTVPSGLPVVEVKTKAEPAPPPVDTTVLSQSPVREERVSAAELNNRFATAMAAQSSQPVAPEPATAGESVAAVFQVRPGQSIQAAIDRALPGDRIEVMPGVYPQTVNVDTHGVTLVGIEQAGERPVLDGQGTMADAVVSSGDDFSIEGFIIRNYVGNGVVVNKAKNVAFRDLIVHDAGLYGVYPVECEGVLVEGCVVSGIADAGIYVGQSRDIVVRSNEVYNNVAGIEIENSVNALVENNSAHHNTAGILVFCLPNNPSKVAVNCKVINNRVWNNNHPNFAKPGTSVSGVVPGLGIVVTAADETEVTQNVIEDNGTYAVVVASYGMSSTDTLDEAELDIEPHSDKTFVHKNIYRNNGKAPSEQFKRDFPDLPSGDLFWDGKGTENQWDERNDLVTFPANLLDAQGGVHTNVVHFL